MECPKCHLENPPEALRCDCGYDFPSGTVKTPYLTPEDARQMAPFRQPREGLPPPKYDWGSLDADFWVGLAACVLVIPAVLFAGGFSFFEPWFLFTVLFMFSAGFVRGVQPGQAWTKGIALGAGAYTLWLLLIRFDGAMLLLVMIPMTIGPATGGVLARRYAKSLRNR
jgi:hypothetical protein